jgi:hypothetical protein
VDTGTPCCAADDRRGNRAASLANAVGPRRREAAVCTWNLPSEIAVVVWPTGPTEVSYYNSTVEIHSSARKHGIADEDIEHAMRNALAIDDQEDDTRLYLGPARSADLLEVVTIMRDDGSELAIHPMKMRPGYRRMLPGADDG